MEKDLTKIILNYLKYWYLFIIGILICVVLAFLHLRYNVVPEYYVSGKILLDDKEEGGGNSGLESLSNLGLIKTSRSIQDEMGVLRSFDLTYNTVKQLGFEIGYYAEGRFSEIEVYEKAIPFKVVLNDSIPIKRYGTLGQITVVDEFSYKIATIIDDENKRVSTHNFGEILDNDFGKFYLEFNEENFIPSLENPITVRFLSANDIASMYNSKLFVYSVNEGGGLLQMELTDAIPQRGIDFINKIIEVYAKQSADHKNELSISTLNIINERLNLLTDDLNSAEKDIENYKQSNALTDVGSDAARFIQLADETERQISLLRTQINSLNSLESSLNVLSNPDTFTTLNSFNIENPIISGAILSFNQALQKRKSTLQASGSGNPMIVIMDKELVDIKNALVSNVRSVKSGLVKRRNGLSNQSAQYRSKISSVPSAERALLEINRDQGLKQNLYLFLLQKREEEALSISVPFSDTRVIETPKSTSYPVTGGKTPIYLGAVLFGLFVPFIFIFAKQTLNTKIADEKDIEKLTDCPILAKIATNKTKDVVVVSENSTAPVAEMFRLMRYNLKFLSQGKSNQVIMVTSAQPGEGKTFISINLGMSLAITGKKVVVLGFDLRAPKLAETLGVVYNYGLSDYIVSPESKINDIITEYKDNNNLSIIGSGAVPPNPGELMLSTRVEQLILELRDEFDYIIIDTPPIGKVADAYALRGLIDATLFVVRENYSPKANINIVNEISENKKLNHLMIVLNDVKISKSSTYGGYGDRVVMKV